MEKLCCIVGAWDPGPIRLLPGRERLLIAADGGLGHLEAQGLTPDVIVGDFDSLGWTPEGANVIRHPVEKDDTDMMLAVKTGLERGCGVFLLYGGLGGRLDHTYANFQTLEYLARRGVAGYLLGEGMAVTAIHETSLAFPAGRRGTLSVFCPGGDARGVCLSGLHYPLRDAVLTSSFPLGVSNDFTGAPAQVSVREGSLLLMWEEPPEELVKRL